MKISMFFWGCEAYNSRADNSGAHTVCKFKDKTVNKFMSPVKLCKYVVYVSTYVRTLTCSIQNKNMNISQMEAAQWKFDKNLLKVKRQFSKSSIKKSKIRFLFFSFEKKFNIYRCHFTVLTYISIQFLHLPRHKHQSYCFCPCPQSLILIWTQPLRK